MRKTEFCNRIRRRRLYARAGAGTVFGGNSRAHAMPCGGGSAPSTGERTGRAGVALDLACGGSDAAAAGWAGGRDGRKAGGGLGREARATHWRAGESAGGLSERKHSRSNGSGGKRGLLFRGNP